MKARLKSDARHYSPLLEPLEQRRLLTSVTGQDPPPNTHDAPVTTDVSAFCDMDINPATVSAQTFAVHGMQTGQILHAFSMSGDTVTLSPDAPFHPGELVQATLTAGIESVGGEPLADPIVWQFRTAASGGGLFGDSGQSLGTECLAVALGDVDGDGDLDAFVVSDSDNINSHMPTTLSVWLNDGSGSFSDSGQSLSTNYSWAVALGDVDGDGDLDAFIGHYGMWPDKVWLNDGSGMFNDSGQSLGDTSSQDVALGDVDGDGDLDAFVGSGPCPAEIVSDKVWLNDGSGNFSDSGQSLGGSSSQSVALGDLDGDGDLDAFVASGYCCAHPGPCAGKVWLNDGSGNFSDTGQTQCFGGAVGLGDVDGDGDLDAFVHEKVWLNDGSGSFSDSGQSLGQKIKAVGDVDGDGDLDAFVGNWDDQPNKVWLNDGSGSFSDSGQSLGEEEVALGDVDGDGDLDAFVWDFGSCKVWLNQDPPPGGFDCDGDVDGDDFLIWQAGFGIEAGATRWDGDADFDGDVDGDDFQIWQANFPTGSAVGSASAAPAARNSDSDRLDFSTSQSKAVDETFSARGNARWTKRSLRDELVDELTVFK